jgi:hypothetical protein
MNKKDLTQYEMEIVNSMERYSFEVVSLQVLSLFFGELEE